MNKQEIKIIVMEILHELEIIKPKGINLKKTRSDNMPYKTPNQPKSKKHPIVLFAYYAYNYDPDFIDRVWEGEPSLIDHLKSKFSKYYDDNGPRGVMLQFFVNLDGGNQEKFCEWIVNNYNG